MLVVETIAKIRRAFFKQGKAIKAICRELGVSRKVVRKVIRSGATEFRYEREDQPLRKIGRWRDSLDQLLSENEAKPLRERLTLIRLFEELRGRGYEGGYDAVRRYARRWAKERGQATAAAFVPLSFAPGDAYQFDWSHEVVLLSGVTVTVKVAHVRLCQSRMHLVRAYPRETQDAQIADIERLMAELGAARDYLQAEGERVRRVNANYAHLAQTASASARVIAESIAKWRIPEQASGYRPPSATDPSSDGETLARPLEVQPALEKMEQQLMQMTAPSKRGDALRVFPYAQPMTLKPVLDNTPSSAAAR